MKDFAGRTALVTGAAQGIARALAARGVNVAITDVDADALTEARESLASERGEVRTFVLDVRDRTAFEQVADKVEDELGPVSLLFNNAGLGTRVAVDAMSYESWDFVMGVNLGGVINGLQTFLPRMLERGTTGHIVNTSSAAGLVPEGGGYLYHGSKFAVVGISESLRQELAPHGIGVSVLCPGAVATGIVDNSASLVARESGGDAPEMKEWREAMRTLVASGISAAEVGEIVIAGIEADRAPWIFTDDMVKPLISARTAAILDVMPSAESAPRVS
ncbi:SDR family NAD(P)-dependent oxidoreductase [Streptomyces sp. NPDC026672]|uniref:SDR family oxidoreductase n=1 Tax=unclassified Streptomyces TaxID=2593676 RepID=UPI0033C03EE0